MFANYVPVDTKRRDSLVAVNLLLEYFFPALSSNLFNIFRVWKEEEWPVVPFSSCMGAK